MKQLGVDYIDYLYVHTPITTPEEFRSGWTPHMFQWANSIGKPWAVQPLKTIDGDDVRELLSESRCKRHRDSGINFEQALEVRVNTWRALEKAKREGKVKMIGVSNYPAPLLKELSTYAEIMPALHQFEFHPKCQQPETFALCKELGIQVSGYAMVQYVTHDCSPVITEIAERTGRSTYQVVLRWVNQRGVINTFSTNKNNEIISNLDALNGPDLS